MIKTKKGLKIKKKILIVEDDNDLNSTLYKFLSLKGFSCDSVYDGHSAVDKIYEKKYHLVLLDVKLPLANGFEVAKYIREFSDIPIIFLTSLDSQKDIQNGFLSGGDDYITKPFELSELLLRIQAILKRVYKDLEIIEISNDLYFDLNKRQLFKNKEPIHLTQKEIKLLELFLINKDKVLDREYIFSTIYDFDEEPNEASLRVFINKLRNIIGKDKIKTIKNMGYSYVS